MAAADHGLGVLQESELEEAERIAYYSTDESDLHRLARQTIPRLVHEVRLHRLLDHADAEEDRWTRT